MSRKHRNTRHNLEHFERKKEEILLVMLHPVKCQIWYANILYFYRDFWKRKIDRCQQCQKFFALIERFSSWKLKWKRIKRNSIRNCHNIGTMISCLKSDSKKSTTYRTTVFRTLIPIPLKLFGQNNGMFCLLKIYIREDYLLNF